MMEELLTRRSIRKYTTENVPDDVLKELLMAAMAAPSAGNEQPWHFIVIRNRKIINKIPTVHPHSKMIKRANAAILVCGDSELFCHGEMWVQGCSAATENLLIAIETKKLGGVWLGVYPREKRINGLRELLGLPNNIVPFALVPIGYPAEKKPPSNRYKESRVHLNGWHHRPRFVNRRPKKILYQIVNNIKGHIRSLI